MYKRGCDRFERDVEMEDRIDSRFSGPNLRDKGIKNVISNIFQYKILVLRIGLLRTKSSTRQRCYRDK